MHGLGLKNVHSDCSRTGGLIRSVEGKVAQRHNVARTGADGDTGSGTGQNAGYLTGPAVDRNGFSNRHASERTIRVEGIDLAAGSGLCDRAGEGLAGCGAAARIGVVSGSRDPSTSSLRVRRAQANYGNGER